MNLLNKLNENISTINDLNKKIKSLIGEDINKEILDLRDEIRQIRNSILGGGSSSLYSYVEIEFAGEYEISLPKYGVENFDRKLKGRMYFSVVNVNESLGFIDVRTKSFPESFILRIFYKKLELFKPQNGKAQLIFSSGTKRGEGPKESIKFEFKKIK